VTFEDLGVPPRFQPGDEFDVRASHIPLVGASAELWIGGSHTVVGEPLEAGQFARSWLIDCAGELPPMVHTSAANYIPRVFEDIEQTPPQYDEILRLAGSVAELLRGSAPADGSDHPHRIYVLCKQGFNRSGLVAGRIMRALGVPGETVVSEIRRHRRGALANDAFTRLLNE
jgi:hypothetical protein